MCYCVTVTACPESIYRIKTNGTPHGSLYNCKLLLMPPAPPRRKSQEVVSAHVQLYTRPPVKPTLDLYPALRCRMIAYVDGMHKSRYCTLGTLCVQVQRIERACGDTYGFTPNTRPMMKMFFVACIEMLTHAVPIMPHAWNMGRAGEFEACGAGPLGLHNGRLTLRRV